MRHDRGHRPFDGYHRRGVISGFYLLYEAAAICRIQWEGYSSSRLTTLRRDLLCIKVKVCRQRKERSTAPKQYDPAEALSTVVSHREG